MTAFGFWSSALANPTDYLCPITVTIKNQPGCSRKDLRSYCSPFNQASLSAIVMANIRAAASDSGL